MKSNAGPANLKGNMFVVNYDCMTAAGPSYEDLLLALNKGQVCSQTATADQWPQLNVTPGGLVALLKQENVKLKSRQELISESLNQLWKNIEARLTPETKNNLTSEKVGLFFASTKGNVEDYIYSESEADLRTHSDPYFKTTENFKNSHRDIRFTKSLTLSNACCSSHVALEFAQEQLKARIIDHAVILAADLVGPFVYQGFNSLKVLSHTKNQPFSPKRDGLQLGEAIAIVLVSREQNDSKLKISQVESNTEGSSITRPSMNGKGLLRTLQAIQRTTEGFKPDFIVAHGTGTIFNDAAEDQALSELSQNFNLQKIPVTNTKWSIGHTLGASGLIDLISACEILKTKKVFAIGSHHELDPRFKMNYLLGSNSHEGLLKQALITSLGFGGVHASLLLGTSL